MEENLKNYIYIYLYTYIYKNMYVTESLCSTPEPNTTLYINYTSILKKFNN